MEEAHPDALARWLSDARAEEDAAARARVRRLVDQAAEEGTLLAACLDLAERSAIVRVDTLVGRSFRGRITATGRDFVLVAGDGLGALIAARAITAVRTVDRAARPPSGARAPVHDGTLLDALVSFAADRAPLTVVTGEGRGEPLTGVAAAVGADVLTLRTEGDPPATVYVALSSLIAVLLPSG